MDKIIIMDTSFCGTICDKDLKDLVSTSESTSQDLAVEIAHNLNETNEPLVLKIICKLGSDKAISYYNKVKAIELSGGLLTTDGLRRRTPGGVFFHLVNTDTSISSDIKKEIFQDTSKAKYKLKTQAAKEKRKKKNQQLKELLLKEGLLCLKNPQ